MATLVLRAGKGSPLTNAEVDANFTNLNTEVAAAALTASWSGVTGKPATLAGYGITDAQPVDADLTAIAALAGTSGFLKKTAANTWALDTAAYLTGINSSQVTTALGFTPYNATNPSGYITASASITGNAATATALQTARTINGVSFNGTTNITIADATKLPLAGGTLTGPLVVTSTGGSATDGLIVNSNGASGLHITPASGDTTQSGRLFFTTGTAGQGFSVRNSAGSLFIQSGATYGSSSGSTVALSLSQAGALNTAGAITQNGSQVLTAGNVSTYALPIGGGTLTGPLTLNNATKGNQLFTTSDAGNATLTIRGLNYTHAVFFNDSYNTGEYAKLSGGFTTQALLRLTGFSAQNTASATSDYASNYASIAGTLSATGAITQAGNQVLHAANYTSYSPSLTGSGASGTWGIGISGNAASATRLINLRNINGSGFDGTADVNATEWIHSGRDFVNGTLITTSIDYSQWAGDPFVLQIQGNSYGSALPFDIKLQGYIYSDTIINYGGWSTGPNFQITAMNVGGYLCFWFARQTYWQGFNVHCYTAYGPRAINKVTSITDVANPGGSKQVVFNPAQVLRSDNYSSYAPTLTGGNASGTWGISVTGSAATLTTGRTIALTGDVTYTSGSFNGSANVTGTATLAASGVTAGTYTKVTVDAKGRVTVGALLASGDLPTYAGTLTSGQITTGLGFTPASLAGATFTGAIVVPGESRFYSGTYVDPDSGVSRAIKVGALGIAVLGGIKTDTLNSTGAITQNGSQVIHAGNYNTYAPTLTGTGASGTWGISVTGNAATVTNGLVSTGSYADPSWITSLASSKLTGTIDNARLNGGTYTINVTGNAGTATTLQTARSINNVSFNGSANITIPRLLAIDDRTAAPADGSSAYLTFGFGSWNNNNTSPYADFMLMRSYTDSSGGNDNMVAFRKDAIGMRLWQGGFGSATAFGTVVDVLHSGNFSSYALPLSGGTVTGQITGGLAAGSQGLDFAVNDNYASMRVIRNNSAGPNNRDGMYIGYQNSNSGLTRIFGGGSGSGGIQISGSGVNDVTIAGNTAINAGNYTSYSPSLTGSGASGTWGINVTGNAASATTAARASATTVPASTAFVKWLFATTATTGTLDWNHVSNTNPGVGETLLLGTATNGPGGGNYYHPFNIEYSGISGVGNVTQMAVAYGNVGNELYMRGRFGGTWTGWSRYLNSSNYTSYSPSLTGSGASGSWGISVTGSAATLTTARTINGTSFNGSANITTANWGTARTLTIGSTGKSVDGSANVAWTLAEIGAAAASHTHSYLPTSGGTLTSSGSSTTLHISDTGVNGANIKLTGDGATTPSKFIRAKSGLLEVINNAYTASILQLTDAGNLTATGNVTAYSDERLKKDWAPLAADFIERLASVKSGTYTRIDNGERQAGSSAQDWQELLPEVVTAGVDDNKTLALAYGNAALVSAIELAKKVVEQDERIKRLEALVEKLIGD